jgi:hypothetical protein
LIRKLDSSWMRFAVETVRRFGNSWPMIRKPRIGEDPEERRL